MTPEQDSLRCVYSNNYQSDSFDCGDDNNDGLPDIRAYSVENGGICGPDPHAEWFSLGDCNDSEVIFDNLDSSACQSDKMGTWDDDSGFCYYDINSNGQWDEHIGIVNEFVDYDVIDGIEYTYAVTSYDMGISPDYLINYNPGLGTIDTTYQSANPLHFASPNGYQSIEGGRGTSNGDKNYVTVRPGPKSSDALTCDVEVFPNPYIARSDYGETEYLKQLRFSNLSEQCKITIYTISGEKVITLNHSSLNGSLFWDMRTLNNQEVAPGLYIYVVEDMDSDNQEKKCIGKFAIVR